MYDSHEILSRELKGQRNPGHPANVRLWLATRKLKTSGNQLGMRLATTESAQQFMSHFGLKVSDFRMICDLSKTPDETLMTEPTRDSTWDAWELVVAEVHRNNCLALEPGFYVTGVRPAQVVETYGREAFCPTTLTYEVLCEHDDWLDQAASHR